jgi:hypothetical protein
MKISDQTTTLHIHTRKILFEDGPTVETKAKHGKRLPFRVQQVTIQWYEGEIPVKATAFGQYTHGQGFTVNVDRAYDLAAGGLPKWLKDAING